MDDLHCLPKCFKIIKRTLDKISPQADFLIEVFDKKWIEGQSVEN
jgi:hypothetical protein